MLYTTQVIQLIAASGGFFNKRFTQGRITTAKDLESFATVEHSRSTPEMPPLGSTI